MKPFPTEPCVNLSAHTAPITQPLVAPPSSSEQTDVALSAQCAQASVLLAFDARATSCISSSPNEPIFGLGGETLNTWQTCKSVESS